MRNNPPSYTSIGMTVTGAPARPHVHIVTTNIKADGSRISLHNLGKNQSEKTRKEIEIDFGLVKAQDRKAQEFNLKPVSIKAEYGKSETKKVIANVLNKVLNDYKFTTMGELNAALNHYNVAADIGSEGSRIRKNNGILYRVLDEDGNRVGVPPKRVPTIMTMFRNKAPMPSPTCINVDNQAGPLFLPVWLSFPCNEKNV